MHPQSVPSLEYQVTEVAGYGDILNVVQLNMIFGICGNSADIDFPLSHCAPQTILEKQIKLKKKTSWILGMRFGSSNSLLKLLKRPSYSVEFVLCFIVWFLL